METLRYTYQPKRLAFALAGLLSAGFGLGFGRIALRNDRGLVIDRIFRFAPGEATILYWVLAAACLCGVAIALLAVGRSFGALREVVLDSVTISAPKNALARGSVTLPLTDIDDLRMTHVRSERFLVIRHAGGKLSVNGSMLPLHGDLDELAEVLRARVLAARRGGTPARKRKIVATTAPR